MSEELAFEACADLANEILEKRNIPDRYTGEQLIKDFVGQNFRGMMISLQAKYKFEMEISAGRDSGTEWRIVDVGGSRSQRRS